jgi:hypothetical protein
MSNGNNQTLNAGAALLGTPQQAEPGAEPQLAQPSIPPTPAALAPPAQPVPVPSVPISHPALQELARKATFGQSVKNLLGSIHGPQYDYQVDENGQMQSVPIKQRPGAIFRNILAASIIGAASGQEAHERNIWGGAVQGLVAGGAANLEEQQRLDAAKRQAAQANFERGRQVTADTREAQRAADQHKFNEATVAHLQVATLGELSRLNITNLQYLGWVNDRNTRTEENYRKTGGILADIPGNNTEGNGLALQEYFTKNPGAFKDSNGNLARMTYTVNEQGLRFDPDRHGFVDESGKPVNLEDRTTVKVWYGVDSNGFLEMSGADILKDDPSYKNQIKDPKATYRVPQRAADAMHTKVIHAQNEAANREFHQSMDRLKFAKTTIQGGQVEAHRRLKEIDTDLKTFNGQYDGFSLKKKAGPDGVALKKRIDDLTNERNTVSEKLKDLNNQYDKVMATVHPYLEHHYGQTYMERPDGSRGWVPNSYVEAGKKKGFTAVPLSEAPEGAGEGEAESSETEEEPNE